MNRENKAALFQRGFVFLSKPIDKNEQMFYNVKNKRRGENMENKSKKEQRNQTARAFRKFARLGLDCDEQNPLRVYKRIDVLCHSSRTKLDMLAVFDTIRLLTLFGDDETVKIIRDIYFSISTHRLSKNEISHLVQKSAMKFFCDERTIYRRLEKVRAIYTKIREKEGFLWDEQE